MRGIVRETVREIVRGKSERNSRRVYVPVSVRMCIFYNQMTCVLKCVLSSILSPTMKGFPYMYLGMRFRLCDLRFTVTPELAGLYLNESVSHCAHTPREMWVLSFIIPAHA